jgi:tetratricopeptide (TPR) repeat protein
LADFLARTRQVVFIATPHTGSGKATLMERLRFIAWGSDSARDLVANKPELRDLNFGYRELAKTRGDDLRHLAYYEMVDTPFGRIVNPDAADPGLPDCRLTPIREDHITIAKPRRRDDLVYAETRSFIAKLAAEPAVVGEPRSYPLEPFKIEWSWQQAVPKLVRVGAVGLVAFGLWQGVPLLNSTIDTIFRIHAQVGEVQERSKETLENIEKLSRQIADLQASRASQPVTPEARDRAAKSIEPAIEDLTRLADERSKRAFEALQKGDTSAAESLFSAILEEKTREGQAANREAARAARNIAAFTRLTNVGKAAQLYRRAASLDPEDFKTWIDLGDMSIAIGQLAQARTAFGRAFAIAERFAQADPGNAGWQFGLGISNERIGNVQMAQGDLAAALKSYEARQNIISGLAQSEPGNAGWQRDLSVSYNKIGEVLLAQGNLADALKSFRDGLGISERLVWSDPGNTGWHRDLSVSYSRIGDVLVAQGYLPEALKSFRVGLAITEHLARSDRGNAGRQRDLSVSFEHVGDVLKAQGNLPEALKSFRDGLAIRDRLAQADPGNAGWQRDLSVSYNKVGGVLVDQGNLPEALESFRDGLAIRDRLAQSDPGNADWQRDLAVSHAKLADAFRKRGEKAKALDALRQGRAIMARMTTLSPDNAVWKSDLAWFDGQIAELAR